MKVFDLKNFDKLDFFGISKKNHFNRKCMRFHEKNLCKFFLCRFLLTDHVQFHVFYIDKKMKTDFANILLSIYHKMRMSKKKFQCLKSIFGSLLYYCKLHKDLDHFTLLQILLYLNQKQKKKSRKFLNKILFLLHTKFYNKNLNITWCLGIFFKEFLVSTHTCL